MDVQNAIERLHFLIHTIPALAQQINENEFSFKPQPNKWSKKEILGHLIDSAANNHQRFIRIQHENEPRFFYEQDQWNKSSYYNEMRTEHIIQFWRLYNLHLIEIIRQIPEESLAKNGSGRDGEKHTLKWYIDDYVDHMEHHLRQIVPY